LSVVFLRFLVRITLVVSSNFSLHGINLFYVNKCTDIEYGKIFVYLSQQYMIYRIVYVPFVRGHPRVTDQSDSQRSGQTYHKNISQLVQDLNIMRQINQASHRSCSSRLMNRNESGRFGALKSDSTHHFFGNACTKSGSLRFSQFSGC